MTIQEKLQQQLQTEDFCFTEKELGWMLQNIGHEQAAIRDWLIYRLFAEGITKNGFTTKQFDKIVKYSISENLINHHWEEKMPAALTRSFAALLNALILFADRTPESHYYQHLSANQKTYFFEQALSYLTVEKEFTGYSERNGWIHCFAHGADFLDEAMVHPDFSKNQAAQALATLQNVFLRLQGPFIEGEERRLGNVICTGLLTGKLGQQPLINWLGSFHFSSEELQKFYQQSALESLLSYVYFHALLDLKGDRSLNAAVLKILKK